MLTRLVVAILGLSALAKTGWEHHLRTRSAQTVQGPALPQLLANEARTDLALERFERVLDGKPNVRLSKARYGSTQVSLVSVLGGMREHHPPAVCLKGEGYEIVDQRELAMARGCVSELTLRRGQRLSYFLYTYVDGEQQTCSLWRRLGSAVLQSVRGESATWTTIQLMDPDRARAGHRMGQLLLAMGSNARDRP
jgi:hypothetical protein